MAVKSELVPLYPNHVIDCVPTYKPDTVKKYRAKKKYVSRSRTRSR